MKHIAFKRSSLYGRVAEFLRWRDECVGTVVYAYTEYGSTFNGLVFSDEEDAVAFKLKFGL